MLSYLSNHTCSSNPCTILTHHNLITIPLPLRHITHTKPGIDLREEEKGTIHLKIVMMNFDHKKQAIKKHKGQNHLKIRDKEYELGCEFIYLW